MNPSEHQSLSQVLSIHDEQVLQVRDRITVPVEEWSAGLVVILSSYMLQNRWILS